jgi:hypothetical protein
MRKLRAGHRDDLPGTDDVAEPGLFGRDQISEVIVLHPGAQQPLDGVIPIAVRVQDRRCSTDRIQIAQDVFSSSSDGMSTGLLASGGAANATIHRRCPAIAG